MMKKALIIVGAFLALSVVAAVAVAFLRAPASFKEFNIKAKQSEAKVTLTHIYTLMQMHQIETESFVFPGASYPLPLVHHTKTSCKVPETPLGEVFLDCSTHRYEYFVKSADTESFVVIAKERVGNEGARTIWLGCEGPLEQWQITEEGKASLVVSSEESCGTIGIQMNVKKYAAVVVLYFFVGLIWFKHLRTKRTGSLLQVDPVTVKVWYVLLAGTALPVAWGLVLLGSMTGLYPETIQMETTIVVAIALAIWIWNSDKKEDKHAKNNIVPGTTVRQGR